MLEFKPTHKITWKGLVEHKDNTVLVMLCEHKPVNNLENNGWRPDWYANHESEGEGEQFAPGPAFTEKEWLSASKAMFYRQTNGLWVYYCTIFDGKIEPV